MVFGPPGGRAAGAGTARAGQRGGGLNAAGLARAATPPRRGRTRAALRPAPRCTPPTSRTTSAGSGRNRGAPPAHPAGGAPAPSPMKVRLGLPWLYAAPALVFVGAVFLYPVVTLVRYSLENVGQSAYVPTTFAGLTNFRYIFSDSLFQTAITNNVKLFLCVPILVVLSIVISAILFDRPKGWR